MRTCIRRINDRLIPLYTDKGSAHIAIGLYNAFLQIGSSRYSTHHDFPYHKQGDLVLVGDVDTQKEQGVGSSHAVESQKEQGVGPAVNTNVAVMEKANNQVNKGKEPWIATETSNASDDSFVPDSQMKSQAEFEGQWTKQGDRIEAEITHDTTRDYSKTSGL
ncbi:hypothetical protein RIF29_15876 [Crotalaria pallida]|uniref:Uncharacterized protein n=1 Tax=Crotalaria pallida TaxID=3830 RepID=A0AAN9ICZ9_CROPI